MTSEDTSVWNSFIQSLDVDPDKAKNIEQLPESQKRQLIESYTIKTSKHSAFHYVTLIKGLRSHRGSLSKSRKGNLQTAREVLNATEISLRTNNVSWVYEFLDKGGLQALQEYMSKTVQNMLSSSALPPSICRRRNCLHSTPNLGDDQLSMECLMEYSDRASTGSRSLFCHRGGTGSSNKKSSSRSASVNKCRHSSNKDNASVTTNCESIHLGVKCYRALLNNQRGCTMIFEQPESINTIALCLLHPSFQTKTLVLELLAAVCLIVGGHERVIAAFDEVCRELGESRRFETLVFFFRSHERLPSDDYSIDFMVSCMQFINIVVHSTEDIAFRVFLQQEFTNLRLDDYLQRISSRVGERLGRQVEAYLDNHVDVTTLLEDSQAKDALQAEVEALDSDLLAVQGQLATTQAEYASRTAAFEEKVKNLQAQISEQEAQLLDNKEELQNLRSRLVDQNSTASSVEKKLQQQITELQEALKAERNRPKVISPPPPPPSALPHTPAPPSTTSSVPSAPPPPPPPPPGSLESGIPAPPPPPMFGGGGAPGFGLAPAGSQAVPIRQPYQTRYKLPLMNWSVLRSQQLRNTIFVGMNDEKVIESLDMDRFEELFRLSSNSILSKSSNEVKSVSGNGENAPDSTTVIDGDSRNSVTSKKAMKKRLMDASRLR